MQLGVKHPNLDCNNKFVAICASLAALNIVVCQINLRA